MTIQEFITRFSDEDSCKEYFRDRRLSEGVTCKNCGSTDHYWLQGKWQFQCSQCRFRTTLKSGTVMENSRLSFQKWFLIMLFMTATKKGISASELQRQTGHKYYDAIWSIMHRIRERMGKRDALYTLSDMIEFDEGYFEHEVPKTVKSNLKRGKGSQRQSNVAVIAESIPLEDINTSKKSKACRFFKMKVLDSHKSDSINNVIKESLDEKCFVFSDKSKSYLDIDKYIEGHLMEKSSIETTEDTLKWVHIAISNVKRNLLGIYHKVNGKYLQNYLDEFIYKLNRRYFNSVFERLIIACI